MAQFTSSQLSLTILLAVNSIKHVPSVVMGKPVTPGMVRQEHCSALPLEAKCLTSTVRTRCLLAPHM